MNSIDSERTRRKALKDIGIATGSFLFPSLLSCTQPIRTPVDREQEPNKEQHPFRLRDALFDGNMYYLLSGESLFPHSPASFDRYKYLSKFDEYGRRVVRIPRDKIQRFPQKQIDQRPLIFDRSTGDPKTNNRQGGEKIFLSSGILDEYGIVRTFFDHDKDTFVPMRQALGKNGWDYNDILFNTWGGSGIKGYDVRDTLVHPTVNIKHMEDLLKAHQEQFPLDQINIVLYSLSGVTGLPALMQNWEVFNNIYFIGCPIWGLNPTLEKKIKVQLIKAEALRRYQVREEVTDYLFELWGNKDYQKQVTDFVTTAIKSGRRIRSFNALEDNEIVTDESANIIKFVPDLKVDGTPVHQAVQTGEKNPLKAHGAPLRHSGVLQQMLTDFGQNRVKKAA